MMQKTQAVRALQEGCRRLGLPNSTAAALLQFLSVKRTHDQFVPDKDRQLRMSPGSTLDKLWHYMLLNTTVSTCVHGLLGGVVDHRGADAWDLADDTKLLQRLYALNVLRLEGHEPDVKLWTEPGTSMHTLHLTASPVSALQSLPGGGRLYVTPSLTQQQQDQLVRALQALYTPDPQQTQPSMPAAPRGPAAAAASCDAEPAAKRPRTQQTTLQQQQQEPCGDASKIDIFVVDQMGVRIRFTVKRHACLGKIFEAYVEHMSIDIKAVYFIFDGSRIVPGSTPESLGMEDGDVIDCFIAQVGC